MGKSKTVQQRFMAGLMKVASYRVDDSTSIPVGGIGRDPSTDLIIKHMGKGLGAAAVLAVQQPLQSAIDELRSRGADSNLVHRQLQAGCRAAARRYGEHVVREVTTAKVAIDRARSRYEERYTLASTTLLKLREAEVRFAVMSAAELKVEAESYINKPDTRPPVEVDLLCAKLRETDAVMSEVVRMTAADHLYQMPWLNDPAVAEDVKTIAKYDALEPGHVVVQDERGVNAAVLIADLVDMHSPPPEPKIIEDFQLP